jgi:hypothetical protein
MRPGELYVELTRRCNLQCAHCFYGKAEDALMSASTLELVFQAFNSVECLVAGGGEPFLNFNGVRRMAQKVVEGVINADTFFIATNGCCENIDNDDVIALLKTLAESTKTDFILKVSNTPYHRQARSQEEELRFQSFKERLKINAISYFELQEDEEFIYAGLAAENNLQPANNQLALGNSHTIAANARRDGVFRVTCEGNIIAGCGHSYADNKRYMINSLNSK